MIQGVDQVLMGVPVSDYERAKRFWVQTMGFELVDDQSAGPERWVRVTPPDRRVVLVLGGARTADRNLPAALPHSPVFFTCQDINETYKELSSKGVEFPQPPTHMGFGWWATFADPDGNRFALKQG